ncbi:hypothetical protein [Agrobacterium sp. DE0009]|uniref:hypothetical protein n=1 Tax=Agrobacterium sp. DE0009 TaxID=2587505 RepID=UPI0011A64AA9|nr:hypothetical protein [Agrobacterium sp. DE0009]
MSDTILRYVPTEPFWQPTPEQAGKAADLLRVMAPKAETIQANFENTVRFFDPGENWSGVRCPTCDAEIEEWWGDAMEKAYETEFKNLSAQTPWCGASVSLNTLKYIWPAGFGRFALEALSPNMDNTTRAQDEELAKSIGAPLGKIWVRN